jgi:hypothetical protein
MTITGFDHFIVLVNNLDAAMQTYRRLGFDAQPGGAHPAFGSHNALIALADGAYIELVAFLDPALATKSFWRAGVERLRVSEGFGGFVLASNDLANEVAQIKERALVYDEPQAGARVRPDGQRVEWHTAMHGGSPVGLMPFLIQDDTPRALRIEPARQGTGSRARVKEVVVAVKNIDAAREKYRALLNREPKRVQNTSKDVTGYRIAADWGSIVLAEPEKNGNALADVLAERGEGIYALSLEVEGLGRDRLHLKKENIPFKLDSNGFLIDPAFACGARIRLV